VFNPAAPIALRNVASDREGSGAWAELVLFDGAAWHAGHCAVVPALCSLLQASGALCGQQQQAQPTQTTITAAGSSSSSASSGRAANSLSLDECGTRVVATVFKLSPGARVQPHTGTTNRRLVLQFALSGSAGVRFRVGNEWRTYAEGSATSSSNNNSSSSSKGDGSALVFDDSFEHEVFHNGSNDRYVLYAAMHHPDRLNHYGVGNLNNDDVALKRAPPKEIGEEAQSCETESRTKTAAELHTDAIAEAAVPLDHSRESTGDMKSRRWAPKQWLAAVRKKIRHPRAEPPNHSPHGEVRS
jgi:hypothetical protein